MKRLRLYTIDADYLKYLFIVDKRVMYWKSDTYKSDRKYIGIVLRINDFDYFAPLSSPKSTDYFYKKGVKHIKKNIIPIIRLVTDKGQLLGKSKDEIRKNALVLYNQKAKGYENVSYLDYTLNFKALEDACLIYEKTK